ncbi:MAG: GNAT family N-acetyltransferase [Myxococcota bacterium]
MTVREAQLVDLDSIQELNRQIFAWEAQYVPSSNLSFPFTDEALVYFRRAIERLEDHAAFVYEDETRQVVGYVITRMIPDSEMTHRNDVRLAQIHTMCVAEGHRGKGIGKQLIDISIEWAREEGATSVKVVAYAGNELARSAYRSAGFQEFEIVHELEL